MTVLVALSLILAFFAFLWARDAEKQAREAQRKANLLREEVLELRARLGLSPSARLGQSVSAPPVLPQAAAESAPPVSASAPPLAVPPVSVPSRPVWPEDQPTFGSPVAPIPAPTPSLPTAGMRAPSLWGPEFSRARMSVFGGALVLGGLAFTLRALGLPQWTLLLSVFAFGAVLYGTARLVPWPVSGALRGLGYGVTALGLGSLAQKLPPAWGPGAVLLGLLLLSAALTWDGLRRREPLLGVMAVGGATLSVWLLTDDLGRTSILAAALVFLLVALAVAGGRAHLRDLSPGPPGGPDALERPDAPQAWRASTALLLGLAGLLPAGWFVTSLRHTLPRGVTDPLAVEDWFLRGFADRHVMEQALFLHHDPRLTLFMWLGFAVLALLPGLALLRPDPQADADEVHDAGVRFGAVWATFLPQALLALVLGVALSRRAFAGAGPDALALGLSLAALAVLSAVAWWAWQRHRQNAADPEETLAGTLSSSLTAGATGVAAAMLVALLGARTEPTALAGLALTLLLIGLHGQSRLWVWLGALGLSITAVWGLDVPTHAAHTVAGPFLKAIPALVALAGALRAAWWGAKHPQRRAVPLAWLAGVGSVTLVAAFSTGGVWLLLAVTALLSAALWLADRTPRLPQGVRSALYWAGLPGALSGAAQLIGPVEGSAERLALLLGAGVAGLLSLLTARRAEGGQPLVEALGLGVLTLSVALLPDGNTLHLPLALALVASLAALLPLRLFAQRVSVLLLLGALGVLVAVLETLFSGRGTHPLEWAGAWLLLLVSWFTQDTGGRAWLAARLPATLRQNLLSLAPLSSPVQAAWFAGSLGLAVTAGLLLFPQAARWWMLAGSSAALLIGVRSCVAAARQDGDLEARARWSTGLLLIALAGLKGATLDAAGFSNPRAVAGLSILVTGLSLLLIAVLAPRPALPPLTAVVERAEPRPNSQDSDSQD